MDNGNNIFDVLTIRVTGERPDSILSGDGHIGKHGRE